MSASTSSRASPFARPPSPMKAQCKGRRSHGKSASQNAAVHQPRITTGSRNRQTKSGLEADRESSDSLVTVTSESTQPSATGIPEHPAFATEPLTMTRSGMATTTLTTATPCPATSLQPALPLPPEEAFALSDAEVNPYIQAVKAGDRMSYVFLLQDPEPGIDAFDEDTGHTAVTLAIERGNNHLLEKLVRFGANLLAPNAYGETPLMVAAACGNTEALVIIVREARLASDWRLLSRALQVAAEAGQALAIQCLMEMMAIYHAFNAEAELDGRNEAGEAAPHESNTGRKPSMTWSHLARKLRLNRALYAAASGGHWKSAAKLIDYGADVNYMTHKGRERVAQTPLIASMLSRDAALVRLLLSWDADPDLPRPADRVTARKLAQENKYSTLADLFYTDAGSGSEDE
ncbi:MAG: hypothetical protein JWP36_1638 [Paucimonas sp.]|nr:hypothetical protein [Paucimonas sp.]